MIYICNIFADCSYLIFYNDVYVIGAAKHTFQKYKFPGPKKLKKNSILTESHLV